MKFILENINNSIIIFVCTVYTACTVYTVCTLYSVCTLLCNVIYTITYT